MLSRNLYLFCGPFPPKTTVFGPKSTGQTNVYCRSTVWLQQEPPEQDTQLGTSPGPQRRASTATSHHAGQAQDGWVRDAPHLTLPCLCGSRDRRKPPGPRRAPLPASPAAPEAPRPRHPHRPCTPQGGEPAQRAQPHPAAAAPPRGPEVAPPRRGGKTQL